MTFEEFFTKKKIDLIALKKADNSLYEEFRKHFAAMGEKSFDHTKKFWFNRLRKSYRLEEVIVDQKESKKSVEVKEQQTVTTEQAIPATGFKPRFRAPAIPSKPTTDTVSEVDTNEPTKPETEGTTKPAGFKPRFRAGATKAAIPKDPATETTDATPNAEQETAPIPELQASEGVDKTAAANPISEETKKPAGFKPRFKAGVTKAAITTDPAAETASTDATPNARQETAPTAELQASEATDKTEAVNPASEETKKPAGFKPRFKAGVTKAAITTNPAAEAASTDATPNTEQETPPIPELQASEGVDKTAAANPISEEINKPAGFKPRFKAGVTKAAITKDPTTETGKTDATPNAEQETLPIPELQVPEATDKTEAVNPASEEINKPAGFKPRFKAGVTKAAITKDPTTETGKTDATPNAEQETPPIPELQVSEATDKIEAVNPASEEINKPAGFKHRFKAGVTKAAITKAAITKAAITKDPATETGKTDTPSDTEQETPPTAEQQVPEATDKTEVANPASEEINKPVGFKPRFKAGVTKVKNKDSE
ncbi:hypothetical protein KO02_22855 [Sphingobacterium sp. ML3W]|uniref:hypothetical protein n=1 Tax=Sphingobacterium sp. ML3W TaxID=1538644 RepID=UPI0004F86B7F|nr:hypothetical protein [Sphingobacterium sp. ML3W]AIM39207.1 hypothetical protein KO02_22855 [Sphingobacterium sp. ML3W]